MFLEKDELVRLTGYVHASKQKAVLDTMGVGYKLRESDNVILVLKDDVVHMIRSVQSMQPVPAQRDTEPNVIPPEALSGFAG